MENIRPNVLIFIDWFIPAYKAGGPIQSVYNIIQQLNNSFNFYVVTSDSDIDIPLDLVESQKNNWINKGTFHVIYLDKSNQNRKTYKAIVTELNFDMVYLNSLFSLRFTLLPLSILSSLKEKIVLAPRGMLGKGSLRIKPFKKKLFLKSFKLLGWHKKVNWHVTTEIEKKSVLNFFGSYASVYLAANLSKTHPYKVTVKIKELNKLNVFFLSRISSIKNLIIAIKTLQYIEPKFKLNLTIIGPVEDEAYWQKCQKELQKLPKNVSYSIMGAVLNNEIPGILKNQHILFLPTRHENFGHVIVESWQNGCPTIISDQTPWTQLEEKKVGVDIPLAQEHLFKEKVEMFASMDQEEFNTWSTSAKKYVYQITNDEMLIKQYKKILSPQA